MSLSYIGKVSKPTTKIHATVIWCTAQWKELVKCDLEYCPQNVFEPGCDPESTIQSAHNDATQPFPTNKPCPNIPLNFILGNSISLKYFIDFMNHIKAEKFLYMWLSVDCFRFFNLLSNFLLNLNNITVWRKLWYNFLFP